MAHTTPQSSLHGVMAEFEDPTALVAAARRVYDEGYRVFDVVLALPDSRDVRRDAPHGPQACVAHRPVRRPDRPDDRHRAPGVGVGGRVSAQHRRRARI